MTSQKTNSTFHTYLWPTLVTGMLLCTIIAGVRTILIALNNPVDLVEEDPYTKGVHYDDTIAELQLGKQLNLLESLEVITYQDKRQLQVKLFAKTPQPTDIQVRLSRPNNAQEDQQLVLTAAGDEPLFQSAPITISAGLWLVELRFPSEKGDVRYQQRLYVR